MPVNKLQKKQPGVELGSLNYGTCTLSEGSVGVSVPLSLGLSLPLTISLSVSLTLSYSITLSCFSLFLSLILSQRQFYSIPLILYAVSFSLSL